MTTAYTNRLGLALPVTGELNGTWGDVVNTQITQLVDDAIAGTTTLSTDADVTLTTTNGASNEARQPVILWTANGSTTRNITAPAASKYYLVINATAGTQDIVIRGVGPTTGVTVVSGEKVLVVWNGSDFVRVAGTRFIGTTGTFSGAVTAASFTGPLTGAVTGNVTGNLTGNVTGNVVGNVTGNVTGNLTGNVTSSGTSTFVTLTATGGVVTMSGATSVLVPTATAGDNSTKAASTAFVNAVAMSAALPAQTGNAGKYITTNGTTASWAELDTFAVTVDVNEIIASPLPNFSSTSAVVEAVALDANRDLVMVTSIAGSVGTLVFVYDASTGIVGAATAVSTLWQAADQNRAPRALLMGTDSVLLVASRSSGEACALSISGTTITVGSTTTLGVGSITYIGKPVLCGSTAIVALGTSTPTSVLVGVTVSGTTCTAGSPVTIAAGQVDPLTIVIDSAKVLALSATTTTFVAYPVSVSGTTLTLGTSASTTATAVTGIRACTLSGTGRWGAMYTNTNIFAAVISVSGTTATMSVATLGRTSPSGAHTCVAFSDRFLAYVPGTSASYTTIVRDVSGTATLGTEGSNVGPAYAFIAGYDSTNAYILGDLCGISVDCTGTATTVDAIFPGLNDTTGIEQRANSVADSWFDYRAAPLFSATIFDTYGLLLPAGTNTQNTVLVTATNGTTSLKALSRGLQNISTTATRWGKPRNNEAWNVMLQQGNAYLRVFKVSAP